MEIAFVGWAGFFADAFRLTLFSMGKQVAHPTG